MSKVVEFKHHHSTTPAIENRKVLPVADQITIVLFAKLFIERFGNIRASFPNSRRTILAARQI